MRMKPDQIPSNECIPALMKNRSRVSDGEGLYLIPATCKDEFWWRMDFSFDGKRKTLSLGIFPDASLSAARALKDHFRTLLSKGINPSDWRASFGKKSSELIAAQNLIISTSFREDSFAAAALRWHSYHMDEWDPSYASKVLGRIKNHLLPNIGHKALSAIITPDIAEIYKEIKESGKLETGARVIKICRRIFDYAITENRLKLNPCTSVAEILKPAITKHFPAILDPVRLAQLLRDIEGYRGTPVVRRALKLKAMLMVRGAELRKAQWQEFDLRNGLWYVPAVRMKRLKGQKENGGDHIVPLPRAAVAILVRMYEEQFDSPSDYVFPGRGRRNRYMSANTLNKALRAMGYSTRTEMTAHGFRATARTLIVESLKVSKEFAELQLAHTVPDNNGEAYNRTTHIPERREMLESWAEFLEELRRCGPEGLPVTDVFTPVTSMDRGQVREIVTQTSHRANA